MYRSSRPFILMALAVLVVSVLTTSAGADYGAQWSALDANGTRPSARKHHTMVYDPVNNRVILYGGEDADVVKNDLWILHLSGTPYWESITASGSAPPPLHGHSAVYDAQNTRMLLFNGRRDQGTADSSFADSVWALTWNNNSFAWERLFQFPTQLVNACGGAACRRAYPRRTHSTASILSGNLYVMGGQALPGMGQMQDMWTHELGTTQWSWSGGSIWPGSYPQCDACFDLNNPTQRFYHSMITDSYGRLVIFGGLYEQESQSNAFYSFNGGPWTYLGSVPEASFNRELHAAVFDPIEERMVVVGGIVRTGAFTTVTGAVTSLPLPGSLPQLSPPSWENPNGDANTAWVLHSSACETSPGPMAEHAAVYDSGEDRIIVFGGVSDDAGTLRGNDTWALDIRDHTPPAAVTISPAQVGKVSSTISWAAPGDDGPVGTACAYDLRRSTSNITEANFYNATQLPTDAPSSAGSSECGTTGPNNPCTWYYYALKTIDDAGNVSAMSNELAIKSRCSGTSYACTGGGARQMSARELPELPTSVEYAIRGWSPARGSTTLFVGVPGDRQGEALEISVYDVAGRRVRTLVREAAKAGDLEVAWDHRNDAGTRVGAGVYLARLRIGSETRSHKIVIARGR